MGVNTYLLDRRTVTLLIGGSKQTAGTLRRFFKLTELDDERAAEIEAAARNSYSPVAALVIDVSEIPLASEPDKPAAAHLVIGWDEDRGSVTDFKWDFLPALGYAVRDPASGAYTLYEERDGRLHSIDAARAEALGLLNERGKLRRHGQPLIEACENVRPFLDKYADADCALSNGNRETLMTQINGGELPPAEWFIGKRPMDVVSFKRADEPQP